MVSAYRPRGPMPYGATELKRVARPYIARALVAGSTGWALLTVALGVWVATMPRPPVPAPIEIRIRDMSPFPRIRETPPAPRLPAARPARRHDAGAVVPVEESKTPSDLAFPTQDELGRSGDVAGDGADLEVTGPADGGGPGVDVLPERGAWYYVEELPELVHDVTPEYPELARIAGVEGTVIVHVLVGRDGHVIRAEIEPSASIALLNPAALAAAKQLVFKPGLVNNRPVAVWVARPYRFRIH